MSFYKYPQPPVINYYVLKHRTRRSNQFCNPVAYFCQLRHNNLFYLPFATAHCSAHYYQQQNKNTPPYNCDSASGAETTSPVVVGQHLKVLLIVNNFGIS